MVSDSRPTNYDEWPGWVHWHQNDVVWLRGVECAVEGCGVVLSSSLSPGNWIGDGEVTVQFQSAAYALERDARTRTHQRHEHECR